MTDVLDQAEKAARIFELEVATGVDSIDDAAKIGCKAGYLLGHAAGLEEGARAFAAWCFQRTVNWVVKSDLDDEVARYLAHLAEKENW